MKEFAIQALKWGGLTAAFEAAAGLAYAVQHHARGDFDTLTGAFGYVVSPTAVGIALGAAVVLGAGIAFIKGYHKTLDSEQAAADALKHKPTPIRRP